MIDPRELIRSAFSKAKENNVPEWDVMTISELKVSLLELTNGEFDQSIYGIKKFSQFLMRYPDLVEFKITGPNSKVRFISFTDEQIQDESGLEQTDESAQYDELLEKYKSNRDWLAIGFLEFEQIGIGDAQQDEALLCKVILNWALADPTALSIGTILQLKDHIDEFDEADLSITVVRLLSKLTNNNRTLAQMLNDVVYRMENSISRTFGIEKQKRQQDLIVQASAKWKKSRSELNRKRP